MSDDTASVSSLVFVTEAKKGLQQGATTPPARLRTRFEETYLEKTKFKPDAAFSRFGETAKLVQKQQDIVESQKNLQQVFQEHKQWTSKYEEDFSNFRARRDKFDRFQKQHLDQCHQLQQNVNQLREQQKFEREHINKLEEHLKNLEDKEQEMLQTIESLNKEIARLKPSADFLEEVASESYLFRTTDAILARYQRLVDFELEKVKKEEEEVKSENLENTIIELHQEIHTLDALINKTEREKEHELQEIFEIGERDIERRSEFATILASVRNICEFAFATQGVAGKILGHLKVPNNTDEQLSIIQTRYFDMKHVITQPDFEQVSKDFQISKISGKFKSYSTQLNLKKEPGLKNEISQQGTMNEINRTSSPKSPTKSFIRISGELNPDNS